MPAQSATNIEGFLHRIPAILKTYPELIAAESTRHGGVSPAPFKSLNLGGSTNDLPENVIENNRRFFGSLDIPLEQVAKSHQVHGEDILKVITPGRYEGYDSLITNVVNIFVAITIADCTPVLIFDPVKKAVAAVHAGWRGTVSEIVRKTVEKMQAEYQTVPSDCLAYIGTCIDECSFEVGTEVAEHFDSIHKRWDEKKSKFFVNLKAANKAQLVKAGIDPQNIEVSPYSTVLNNADYFSYRLENGSTGRMLVTIGIKA